MCNVKLTLISIVAVLNGSPAMASNVLTPRRRILGTRRIFALLHAGPSTRFQTLFGLRAAPRSVQKTRLSGLTSGGRSRNKAAVDVVSTNALRREARAFGAVACLRPEPQRGSCVVSALSGHLRRHSGSLHSAWESFSLFYLASRRASVLRIGCILENLPVAKSFFLRFSLSGVPYISRGPWPKLRPRPGPPKKVHFSFLLFPYWMCLR